MPEPGRRQTVEDISAGEVRTTTVENVERRDFVKYAGASGDFNPIHYDEPYATDAGNPSVFAQGMWTAGIASTVVTDWFGVGAVRGFSTRFEARVFPDDTITARATVVAVEDGASPTAEVNIEVVNQADEVVVTGEATIDLQSVT